MKTTNTKKSNKAVVATSSELATIETGLEVTEQTTVVDQEQVVGQEAANEPDTGVVIDNESGVVLTESDLAALALEESDEAIEQQLEGQPEDDVVGQSEDDQPQDDAGQVEDDQPQAEPTIADLMAIITAQQEQLNQMAASKTNNHTTGRLLSGSNSATKADVGRSIWDAEMVANKMGCPVRGHTINRLVVEAGLTKAGAATYYQNMKKKAGFVNSK